MNPLPTMPQTHSVTSGRVSHDDKPELTSSRAEPRSCRWELAAFVIVLLMVNTPLASGGAPLQFRFLPHAVLKGEWWRLITHPFAHLSPYHLALDAAAFLLVYIELRHFRVLQRLFLVASAAIGSLLTVVVTEPRVWDYGLCGLSGVAHGLTAIAGLEFIRQTRDKLLQRAGWFCFLSVVAKAAFEAASGHVLLEVWHLGNVGTPLVASHAGGVLGALVGALVISAAVRMRAERFGQAKFPRLTRRMVIR